MECHVNEHCYVPPWKYYYFHFGSNFEILLIIKRIYFVTSNLIIIESSYNNEFSRLDLSIMLSSNKSN